MIRRRSAGVTPSIPLMPALPPCQGIIERNPLFPDGSFVKSRLRLRRESARRRGLGQSGFPEAEFGVTRREKIPKSKSENGGAEGFFGRLSVPVMFHVKRRLRFP